MNEQIKQVALRLQDLREALDLSVQEVAEKCGITPQELQAYESGNSDIPMNFLCNAAEVLGVDPMDLFSGASPTMSDYWLVRKGKGETISRTAAYKYQGLALGFKHAKASPFIVTVEPKMEETMHLNSHEGQEFNLVLKGRLRLVINGKELILEEGDSIYFDATKPHGMQALDEKPTRFLAIII